MSVEEERMRVVVVGGGHNGLVAGCYLARAGAEVLVLEQAERLGGGSRTDELLPGFRFNTHSAAHNIIHATGVLEELDLTAHGLTYREMDPFAVSVGADGRIVRFHRDVEATVASIAEADPAEGRRYRAWMRDAMPVVGAMRAAFEVGSDRRARTFPLRAASAARALARNGGPLGLARLLTAPYGQVLAERLATERVRAPVAAFAAHASASPTAPGGATFALWQAFYHQVGQWHAVGGSQALVDALARSLGAAGGEARTGAAVARIGAQGQSGRRRRAGDGERIAADAVVTAIDPRTALLDLLDPPLGGAEAARPRGRARRTRATPSRCGSVGCGRAQCGWCRVQ